MQKNVEFLRIELIRIFGVSPVVEKDCVKFHSKEIKTTQLFQIQAFCLCHSLNVLQKRSGIGIITIFKYKK